MIPSGKFLYRSEQIKACETMAVQQYNISENELMSRAGHAAFTLFRKLYPRARRLAVFCGAGNNGGDGYVMAQLARQEGLHVKIYQSKAVGDLPPAAAHAARQIMSDGIDCLWIDEPLDADTDVIVDALLGIGLQGEVRGEMLGAINQINESGLPVLALDVPSGLNADTGKVYNCCVKATHTISFIAIKTGMYTLDGPDHCGDIYCSNLQIRKIIEQVPPAASLLYQQQLAVPLPKRQKNTHKADFGHVLVIGGGPGMPGAAALAAKAALRTGAGSVTVATWPEHVSALLPICPEAMVHGIESANDLEPLLERASVCILGPGLGEGQWGQMLFKTAMTCQLPMVIDASALRLLTQHPQHDDNWVLTPHPGEAAALLSCSTADIQQDRFEAVKSIQQAYGGVIVLKGVGSLVRTANAQTAVNPAGNPGMASAGMGDVLSGIIAGLMAQGLSLSESASAGVWLHACAADFLVHQQGCCGLLASDLFDVIPKLVNGLI